MDLLPVHEVLDDLINALQQAPQTLLLAPPGAGKSTWLPLQLLTKMPLSGKIIMLEPRRLAVRNVAARLAAGLNEDPGQTVGYRIRGEQKVGYHTRIEVVTEGILIRMLQRDPMLKGVALVILDEFHERSLQADLALTLLLDVQQGLREDLKLLIMSATLDNQQLACLLPNAPCIISNGRSFPVTRHYHPLPVYSDFASAVVTVVMEILENHPGSLLLFLPGERDIDRISHLLASRCYPDTELFPLHGALPLSEQQEAIQPVFPGKRKVVLATNIAETSLTIEGITLVVDSGLEKCLHFDSRTGVNHLDTQWISQASMIQRAGRAGRLQAGQCWHLIAREQAQRLAPQSEPEIVRSDLSGLLSEVLAWGCSSPAALRWLTPPPAARLAAAGKLLCQLGATDRHGQLTTFGRKMAAFATEPRLAAILSAAGEDQDKQATAALLVAIIEQPDRRGSGDLREAMHKPAPYWQQRARQLVHQVGQTSGGRVTEAYLPCLLVAGFADHIARRRMTDDRYLLANGHGARLPLQHPLCPYEWLIVLRQQLSGDQSDAVIQLALPFDLSSVQPHFPDLITKQSIVDWDQPQVQFRVLEQDRLGEIIVHSRPGKIPAPEILCQAFLGWVRKKGLNVLPWDAAALQLRERLLCAGEWLPEEQWPAADDEALSGSLETWLLPEIQQIKELRSLAKINLSQALSHLLVWQQRQLLDKELPGYYTLASGSRVKIRYQWAQEPVIAVRIQEMFGQSATPFIAKGRIPLLLELLSPAQRPIQVTKDLAGFWQGSWREVQKEMKGRYPKHLWPDDPANTLPANRAKRVSVKK